MSQTDYAHRPLIHFTPRSGWINDPNGLVYFDGEWHLCCQYYNPDEVDGMQWGHAVSTDLLHWTHLPPAIGPDEHGHIWSGSAVVDRHDVSGFFGGKPGMVCFFTYWRPEDGWQSQGLAYSPDGREFTTFSGNPILPRIRNIEGQADDKEFRDPKVFYHPESSRWVMVTAGGKLRTYSSANLIDWQFEHCHEDLITECPDLFRLPVDNDPEDTRWVLNGAGRWYMLGEFDGRRFTPETEAIPFGAGPDFYATQTWSDVPDGRCITLSWIFRWGYGAGVREGAIHNPFPTDPVAGGSLGIPSELSLRSTADGVRLHQEPVRELNGFWKTTRSCGPEVVCRGDAIDLRDLSVECCSIDLECSVPERAALTLRLNTPKGHIDLVVDNREQVLVLDRRACGVEGTTGYCERFSTPLEFAKDGGVRLRLLFDRSVLEIFAQEGRTMVSAFLLPTLPPRWQALAEGGDCCIESVVVRSR